MLITGLKQAYSMAEKTDLGITLINPSEVTANTPRNVPITHTFTAANFCIFPLHYLKIKAPTAQ